MEEIIGATISEAQELMTENTIRVSVRDGEHLVLTCDYRSDRINVETQDDTIVKITGIG
jgi:hypothetical protein